MNTTTAEQVLRDIEAYVRKTYGHQGPPKQENTMTAEELIAALQELDPDTVILVAADEYGDPRLEPANCLEEIAVQKLTVPENPDIFCYEYPNPQFLNQELTTAFIIQPKNLGFHYWDTIQKIRIKKLREEHRIGALTGDDFDPPL